MSRVADRLVAGYALVVGGVLFAAVAFPAGVSFVRPHAKGESMSKQVLRWRLLAGAAFIALAAIVAIVGYLKISSEPDMTRQIPYVASAGFATIILAVVGGSLIVADQIRAEDERVDDIERAVERLADLVRPGAEAPPRLAGPRRARSDQG
jgi:hypothetical protein